MHIFVYVCVCERVFIYIFSICLQPATFQLVLMTDGFQSVAIISYRTIWPANEHLKVDTYISGNHLEPIIGELRIISFRDLYLINVIFSGLFFC